MSYNFSNEDIEIWNNFKIKCNKNYNKNKKTIFTKEGKDLLKNIISKIKYEQENSSLFKDREYNNNFLLKKDTSLGIDSNSNKKLHAGKYKIDCKLDLHGESLKSGYDKTYSLFEKATKNHYRCLLIITGKGLHSNSTTLKSSILQWFSEPYFANKIIKYTNANYQDGGNGAIYVLLRKI